MPIILKSGSLSLLEPYGPVQACNGIALPLPFYCIMSAIHRYLYIGLFLAICEVHQTPSSHVNITNTEKGPFLNQHLFLKGGGGENAQWLHFSSKAILKKTFLLVYIFHLFVFLYDDGHPCIYQAFISEMTSKGFY